MHYKIKFANTVNDKYYDNGAMQDDTETSLSIFA